MSALGLGMFARIRRVGVAWTPSVLFAGAGVGGWYDPARRASQFQDAAGTIPVTAPGQPVGRMLDLSGQGRHASQADAARRPTYQIDGQGLGHLAFDGVDDLLVTEAIVWNSPQVSFVSAVHKPADTAALVVAEFGSPTDDGSWGFYAPAIGGSADLTAMLRGTDVAFVVCTDLPAPRTAVVSARMETGPLLVGEEIRVQVDGQTVASTVYGTNAGTGALGTWPLRIGSRVGKVFPFLGRFYGLIMMNRILSDAELARAEGWLSARS
ncbi:MAG: hypothetical protein ACK41P_01050 [Asticcacaulis sp.]